MHALPRLTGDARFVDCHRLGGRPHIVVDGPVLPGCVLTLSHWPTAATPDDLAADTSTGIVDRYLRACPVGPEVGAVTNNHYDEDGALGLWLALERPSEQDARRALAVAAAEAGDFRSWVDPWAARVAVTLAALAERATTPFPGVLRALADQSGRDPAGAIYEAVLPRVGDLLADPGRYERYWRSRWDATVRDLDLIDGGEVRIEEHADADLAVVRAPRSLDPLALHTRTRSVRVLTILTDGVVVLQDRYETWVRYVSRRLPARVDLAELAAELQRAERNPGVWRYEGVAAITPRLYLGASGGVLAPTSIDPARIVEALLARYSRDVGERGEYDRRSEAG